MNSRRVSAVAAVVTVLSMAGRWGPGGLLGQVIDGWVEGTGPAVLPLFGTVGQTVLIYNDAIDVVQLFVPLALGVGLGVWLARSVRSEELRAGLRAVAVGSTAVVMLAIIPVVVVWGGLDPTDLAMALAMSLNLVVAGPVYITVAAAAGVTLESLGFFGGSDTTSAGVEAADASADPDSPDEAERSADPVA